MTKGSDGTVPKSLWTSLLLLFVVVAGATTYHSRIHTFGSLNWLSQGPRSIGILAACGLALLLAVTIVWRVRLASLHKAIIWGDQIVVVTGAAGGLGSALVRAFSERGARIVVAVDLKPTANSNAAKAEYGIKAIQADLSDSQHVKDLASAIHREFGKPTVLVNNAGIMHGKPLLELQEGEFEKSMKVNVLSSYYTLREFLPSMVEADSGHVITTASIMSYIPISHLTDYVASKHALLGLVESLHYEMKKSGVSFWLLVLGKLDTPLFAAARVPNFAELLAPTQDPEYVAKAVIDRLEALGNGKGGLHYLHLPLYARFVALLKAMPTFVMSWSKWLTAADEALQAKT
ncbi:NAD(P)-binding protein [Acaromyces ingoldii]|uniref:NAD(P)-binding protein n=1 Tax=Acaromyces ingoldii TaxID=215250 RepID=A0A316YLQ5_9BASI|nr:NAD(P)-binding protein [Acaromyces ingoldii]PWN90179.1 NAD(P)-binding protein [Acaromyces ingoldii]